MQDHHAFEDADLQDPMRTQSREPEILPELPVGPGEILIFEAFPFFEHEDGIAFFGESHRGDASPKARADDDVIVGGLHTTPKSKTLKAFFTDFLHCRSEYL